MKINQPPRVRWHSSDSIAAGYMLSIALLFLTTVFLGAFVFTLAVHAAVPPADQTNIGI